MQSIIANDLTHNLNQEELNQDSQAAVLALNKGNSTSDELATTIVRACRMMAAYLHCNI